MVSGSKNNLLLITQRKMERTLPAGHESNTVTETCVSQSLCLFFKCKTIKHVG